MSNFLLLFFYFLCRSTREQIALAEAKLLELSRADPHQEGSSKSSSLFHPSLPCKPPPVGPAQPGSSRSSNPKSTLPSLPLATPSKESKLPNTSLSVVPKTSTTSLHSVVTASTSHSTSTKKASKLMGIKIIKKAKDI